MRVMAPAKTPEEISALRAQIFLDAANEIEKIGKVKREELVQGSIGVALDAVHAVLGKSERDFAQADEKVASLLTEMLGDVLKVRVRNRAHAFNLAKTHIAKESDVYAKKLDERTITAECVRRIGEKLTNGHAGTWI